MKIFLCGQKSFGRAVLKQLYEDGHTITGVAPAPQVKYKDKVAGYALLKDIPIISDCDKITSSQVPEDTELIVSAHSHWMISQKAVDSCRYGGIGFHPSLLPRHRGQDAIRWAVHMKDYVTGATVYKLTDKCDGGDILLQKMVWIDPEWDYHDLWEYIFPIGVQMMSDAVKGLEQGTISMTPQDETYATWEPSWERTRLKRNDLIMIG